MYLAKNKHRIFTFEDWRNANSLDKMYMHMMEPHRWELSKDEMSKLQSLRAVFAIITEHASIKRRSEMISRELGISEVYVKKLIKEAQLLFGDILSIDTQVEMSLMYERYMFLYEKCKEEGDMDTARRCLDSATALLEKVDGKVKPEKKEYAKVVFTNDATVIESRMPIEDAETDEQ